jgi:hypothetical protein
MKPAEKATWQLPAATIVALALGLTLPACAPPRVTGTTPKDPVADITADDAKVLWEEAIRAKGGRERLHAIRNFVMSSSETFPHSPRPDVISHEYSECLYVMPTRYWEYYDYRPGKMGDNGLALDTNQHRVLNQPGRGPAQGLYEDLVSRLREGQVVYLMETAFVRPEPVGVKRGRVGRIDVDVVETRVDADRVEFSFDRRTHLPVRIVLQDKRFVHLIRIYRLSDYRPVDGIEMARNVSFGADETKSPTTYTFNVEYDESVFMRGSVRFQKNGWMKQ